MKIFLLAYPIFLIFSFGSGLRLLSLFRYEPSSKLVHFFLALVLGYAFTGQLIFILGLLSLLNITFVWIVFVIGIVLNLGVIILFLKEIKWSLALESIRESTFLERAFFFMSIIVILLYQFFSLAPQIHWDAMSYHYLVPKHFLENNGLIDFPDIIFSYYPSLIEMQFLAGMALGGETTANLIGNSHAVLFYLGVFALAIFHLKKWRIGIWAGVVILCTRGIHNHFEGGWNDLGTSVFIVASIMILFEYCKTNHKGLFFLSAIFIGAALASKHYSWIPFIFIVIFLLWDKSFKKHDLKYGLSKAAIFFLIAVSIPFLWYLRSYIYTGNPVYPFSVFGIFPTYILQPFVITSWVTAGFPRNPVTFLLYPFYLLLSRDWVSELSGQFSYLLMLAPMSLVEIRRNEVRAYWVLIVFVLIGMYFIAPFETRYMYYILPFASVLAGYGVLITIQKTELGRKFVLPVIFVLFLIPFSMNQKYFDHYWNDRLNVIIKREWKDQYLLRQSHNYGMIHWMNNNLPPDSKVLCLENRLYRLEKDFITWYGMSVKYPQNAIEAMEKNHAASNTHMYLGEMGMAQAYILWNIYNLTPDRDGFVEFTTDDILFNLFDEPIPDKFWILRFGVSRDMDRWGFDTVIIDNVKHYRVNRENLNTAIANHAAILLVDLFRVMIEKEWIVLAGDGSYDGLNVVLRFDYEKYHEDMKISPIALDMSY